MFIRLVGDIIRNGVVVIVINIKPTLEIFFLWQTRTTIIYVLLLRLSLLKIIENPNPFFIKLRIEKDITLKIWKFAMGDVFNFICRCVKYSLR